MGNSSQVERIFEEACQAIRQLRYNLAYDLFTEVMEMVPENSDVHYNRGLAAGHLLKWAEAESNFDMALRIRKEPDYFFHRAMARLHQRRWAEGLEDLDGFLSQGGSNDMVRSYRQDLVFFLGNALRRPADFPFFCEGWFDERLDAFIGVDPEIIPKAERAVLRRYIAEAFEDEGPPGCDHTHRITEEWALVNGRDPRGVARFLHERGLPCDCRVLAEGEKTGTGN